MSRGMALLPFEGVVEVAVSAEGPSVVIDQEGDQAGFVLFVKAYWTS